MVQALLCCERDREHRHRAVALRVPPAVGVSKGLNFAPDDAFEVSAASSSSMFEPPLSVLKSVWLRECAPKSIPRALQSLIDCSSRRGCRPIPSRDFRRIPSPDATRYDKDGGREAAASSVGKALTARSAYPSSNVMRTLRSGISFARRYPGYASGSDTDRYLIRPSHAMCLRNRPGLTVSDGKVASFDHPRGGREEPAESSRPESMPNLRRV